MQDSRGSSGAVMTSFHDQVNYDPLAIHNSLRQTPADCAVGLPEIATRRETPAIGYMKTGHVPPTEYATVTSRRDSQDRRAPMPGRGRVCCPDRRTARVVCRVRQVVETAEDCSTHPGERALHLPCGWKSSRPNIVAVLRQSFAKRCCVDFPVSVRAFCNEQAPDDARVREVAGWDVVSSFDLFEGAFRANRHYVEFAAVRR